VEHVQVEKAQSTWNLETEESAGSLIQINLPSGNVLGNGGSMSAAPKGAAAKRGAGVSKAKSKANANPLVIAATARAKTAKMFLDVERNLNKALAMSEGLLDCSAPKILREEAARTDSTLALVRSRRELVLAAIVESGGPGPETTSANLALFKLCLEDPYLRDCRGTILDETTCQTLGAVRYSRNMAMDL
jgi:hypothetical protein